MRRMVSLSVVALALLAGCDRTDRDFGEDGTSRVGFEPTDAVHRAGSTGFVATGHVPDGNQSVVAAIGPDGTVRWQAELPTRFGASHPTATFAGDAVNVVGTTGGRLEVAQLRAGALDETYGDDGIVSTRIAIDPISRPAALSDSRGRTVVVGQRGDAMVYARIGTGGAVERDVEITLVRNVPVFGDAVMTADDKVVVAYGRDDREGGSDLVVTRLLPSGELDHTFSGDGILTIAAGQDITPSSIVVRPDGRTVVAGTTRDDAGAGQVLLAGLTAEGEPDPAFGVYGLSIVDAPGATAPRLVLGGPGLIVATAAPGGDVSTLGFDAAGAPDDAWGDGGRQVHDLGGAATASDIVQLSARALVLASTADDPGGALLAVR
jgi:hypothetical protein